MSETSYHEKCSCGAEVEIIGKDSLQITFSVERWLKAHEGCRPGVMSGPLNPEVKLLFGEQNASSEVKP
jgi:hypothetical protein